MKDIIGKGGTLLYLFFYWYKLFFIILLQNIFSKIFLEYEFQARIIQKSRIVIVFR